MEIKSRIRKPSNKKVTEEIHTESLNFENTRSKACVKNPARRLTHGRHPRGDAQRGRKGNHQGRKGEREKIPGERRNSPLPGPEKRETPWEDPHKETSSLKPHGTRTREEQENNKIKTPSPRTLHWRGDKERESTKNLTGKKVL